MARISSTVQFNIHNFTFGGATAAFATNTTFGAVGGYRYGWDSFDNALTTTFNAGGSRLTSYANDLVRPTTGPNAGHVTSGTVDAFVVQNLVATSWRSAFVMSDIGGSAAAFDAALRSASTTDDGAFIESVLGGDDLMTLSKYDDDAHGYVGNDTIRSGLGNDWLAGDTGNDSIDGGAGLDSISGGDGNDIVIGGRSADSLLGGNDDDILRGGDGNDLLTGGPGSDRFVFSVGDDRDTVTTFTQGADMLQVLGMTAGTLWTKAQEGANTVVNVMGLQIVIEDTSVGQMTLADFIFA